MTRFLTLFANERGELFEHPGLGMLGGTLDSWVLPEPGEMIPLPGGSSLVMVPEHYPVGWDWQHDRAVCLESDPFEGKGRVYAVAALLPQGFTRTYLPVGVVPPGGGLLPLLGYAAVGLRGEQVYVAAIQTDRHHKWHPRYYNTEGLEERIYRRLQASPGNRILKHLSHCARHYSCFTAQNIFYERWEGGIPSMPACNAGCIACISEDHAGVAPPQNRLDFVPETEEIVEVGLHHLTRAREAIISFGQGCEGEPSLNYLRLAEAIRVIREATGEGTINLNTNAGFSEGIRHIVDAGLNAMRVTLFSCDADNYNLYHQPKNYGLRDVENSIRYAREHGVYVSLNLLTFPGFTDREEEIKKLRDFIIRNDINMVQLRNLNVDPRQLQSGLPYGGKARGIVGLLKALQQIKGLRVGSYSYPVPGREGNSCFDGGLKVPEPVQHNG